MIDPSSIVENLGNIGGIMVALWIGGKKVWEKLKSPKITSNGCTTCTKEVEMESLAKQVQELSRKMETMSEDVAFMRGCMETFLKIQTAKK